MAVRDCYINQHNPIWSGLYLDKNQLYTVDRYGCIVCCAAMCICHRFGITHDNGDETNPGKKQIIEAVIANCCDSNGDFYYNAYIEFDPEIYGNNNSFLWTRTDETPDMYGWPIVYYKGHPHAVLFTDPWTVLDPANEAITTASQADARYTGPKSYWVH